MHWWRSNDRRKKIKVAQSFRRIDILVKSYSMSVLWAHICSMYAVAVFAPSFFSLWMREREKATTLDPPVQTLIMTRNQHHSDDPCASDQFPSVNRRVFDYHFLVVLNFIFFGSIKSWCGRGRDLRRKRETGIFKDRRLWNVTFCCCLFKKKSEWPTRGEQQFLLKLRVTSSLFILVLRFHLSKIHQEIRARHHLTLNCPSFWRKSLII